ncbi:hypothetical protein RRG08_027148 [Elysia crispata]|uniref:Fanconi anemia group M protein n=1 Tax=Elysia crispata TaxID=231223 RepID=A0AAE0YUY0_9GAST|nr:hypothetical protein RRG08_027148 [Elysia crispata]
MEFDEQEFSDADDELLAHADLPQGNKDLNYDQGEMNFDDDLELMEEDNPSNISAAADGPHLFSTVDNTASNEGSSGFDITTGKLWIYPTNYPVRDYQYNIVQQALFKNTLVVLPTGLGKTFIAAVVMYNFYRWFPQGKVVFMAPTKPLVAQQMQACYNIMGIPKSDTIEMTGTIHPAVRQRQWKDKRVIFLTPQVMTNDLSRGSCEAKSFKCLVVDEAHKALGNQSYCQVIRELCKFTNSFRVLALSATPGSTLKAVQTVMNNLLVSHIELRTEDSIDIKPYTHERKVEKVVVPLGEELSSIKEQYIQIMTFVTQRLTRSRALYNRQATSLSKFLLLKARDEFRQNPPQNIQPAQRGMVEADFCMAISLYHGYDLLQLHGLRSLYNFLMGLLSGEKGYGRTRAELLRNADFNSVMDKLHHKFAPNANSAGPKPDDEGKVVVGHPKMQVLEKIVVEHFQSYNDKNTATKVVIFSQFRDSVQEIASILNQHQPLVKVMPFIGQSSSGKEIKGFTQKEQLEVMRQFREAGCNTLVSTCVGEEGLDIGDVDLIICFDAHKSPIRLVQRMGRTGRKREGKIVMLVTEGKEEQIYNQSVSSKKSIHKAILNGAKSLRFYPNNPRMVPVSLQPQCHKMYITIPEENKKTQAIKNKRSSFGGKQRQSIPDAIKKQGTSSSSKSKENLFDFEYEEIRKEFALVPTTSKHLSTPTCMVLTNCHKMLSQGSCMDTGVHQSIDLSEWTPWQNRLQKTFFVEHSIQSKHLVKNSQFIEIQRVIGEEEDNYAIEMKQYVNCSFVNQSNITSFLLTPAKVKGAADKENETVSTSLERAAEESKAGPSTSKDIISYVMDSSDSDTQAVHGDREDPSMEKSKEKSHLFTETRNANEENTTNCNRGLPKRKNSLSSSQQFKKKSGKRNSSKSACLMGTPPSSAKSRIRLVKKSKKTLQKRKSALSHLLESKLSAISETRDKDDFENNSQTALEIDVPDHSMNGEVISKAEDTYNENQQSIKLNRKEDNVLSACDGSEERSGAQKQLKLFDLIEGKEHTSSQSKSMMVSESVHFVPPAPSISELDNMMSGLCSAQDFAKLELDKLVQDWGIMSEQNACKNFSQKYTDFSDKTKSNGAKCEISCERISFSSFTLAEKVKFSQQSVVLPVESNISLGCLKSENIGDEQDKTEEKEEIIYPSSPTFKNSGLKGSNSDKIFALQEKSNVSKNHQYDTSFHTNYGNADNPVIISPDKAAQNNKTSTVISLPLRDSQISQNEDCINFSAEESQDCQQALPFSTGQKGAMSPLEISHSPGAEGEENGKQNFSVLSERMVTFDVSIEKERTGMLEKSENKSLGKKQNLSESFITLTQAHDCLLTSSSENSHETACNPTTLNSTSRTISSPSHSFSTTTKDRKNVGNFTTPKKSQISIDNFLSYALNNVEDLHHTQCNDIGLACSTEFQEKNRKELCSKKSVSAFDPKDSQRTPPKSKVFDAVDNSILAQFDLGFDWDEEVIPPTPDKVSPQVSAAMPIVKRPLFSETSNEAEHKKPRTKQQDSSDLSRLPMSTKNNYSTIPLKKEINDSQKFDPQDAEDIQADFDLCAELDDLDPWSDDQSNNSQLHKNVSNQQIKVDPIKSPCPENQELVSTEVGKPLSVNDVVVLTGSPNSSQAADLVFQNYKTDHIISKDISSDCNSSKGETTLSVSVPYNKECKSKPNKLKLSKKMNDSSSDDSNKNKKPTIVSISKGTDQLPLTTVGHCPKNKPSKIRFNLKVPDFSDSDDDIVFLDKIKPSKVSGSDLKSPDRVNFIPAGNPLACNDTSVSRETNGSSLSSPVQSSSACLVKFSPSKSSCSTPLRPHLSKNKRTRSCHKDDGQALTPIRISPERTDHEERSQNISMQRKWLNKEKHSVAFLKKNDLHHKDEPFPKLDADDLDDFEEAVSFQKASKVAAHPVGPKKKLKKPGFVEEEAEVSGDQASSDEDDIEGEDYDLSFIDNHSETQGPDMQSMYLKSVKNPVPGSRYKLQFNTGGQRHEDIYSQAPEESQGFSEYEEDSFCVGSNEEESEMESPPKKLKKQKSKSKKLKQVSGKRVIRMLDSSSEEEVPPLPMTQEFQTNCSRKVALLSSDDEMDGIKRQKKKMRKIEDDTQNLTGENSVIDIQTCELSQNIVQRHQTLNREIFTLLKENPLDSTNPCSIETEDPGKLFQDGDFNLLDDEWLQELDFPNEQVSKSGKKAEVDPLDLLSKAEKLSSGSHFNEVLQKKASNSEKNHAGKTSPIFERNESFSHRKISLASPSVPTECRLVGNSSSDFCKKSSFDSINNRTNNTSLDGPSSITTSVTVKATLSREERLQKQREKQERFRLKLAGAKQRRGDLNGERSVPEAEVSYSPPQTSLSVPAVDVTILQEEATEKSGINNTFLTVTPKSLSTSMIDPGKDSSKSGKTPNERISFETFRETPLCEASRSIKHGVPSASSENTLQVLVDSREISGAQDIISSLRLKHGIIVTARRLSSCDYIVSNHTAVDRLSWSYFSNSTNRSKLSSRVNEMQALYDRCVLIVEDDRVKSGQDKTKKHVNHTKYLDTTIAYLMQTKVKVYFTGNHDETGSVLAELCQAEARKGRSLNVLASLNDKKEDMLNFVLSIPGVTMPQALNLVHNYRNIIELAFSPVTLIQERGQMMLAAAQSIHKFFRHHFDKQMMPEAKR